MQLFLAGGRRIQCVDQIHRHEKISIDRATIAHLSFSHLSLSRLEFIAVVWFISKLLKQFVHLILRDCCTYLIFMHV